MKDIKYKYDILVEEISTMADRTSALSRRNKRKSFKIYMGIAGSSALITILVAIGNDIPEKHSFLLKITTLALSGLATILAAWDGFYNHKQQWINYGESRNHLRSLQLKLRLLEPAEKENDVILRGIYEEYQDIMQNGNSNWKTVRMQDPSSNS